jgi:rhodanese-related sulfurtransferase
LGVVDRDFLFLPVNLNTQNYLSMMFPDLQRNHPILFDYRFINEDIMKVRIPPEFEIAHLPGAIKLDQPFGLFQSTYSVNQDTLIHKRLFIRRELLIPTDDYARLKEFYDRAAEEDSRQIILRRNPGN